MSVGSELSASRTFYSQIHAYSNVFSSGWIRGSTITTTRSVRDIDDDKSRLFTEIIRLPAENPHENEKGLISIKGSSFEVLKPVFQDISPSGNFTLSLSQSGKTNEIPMISLNGDDVSHYLDVADFHGNFVGDSWFGGVSWSTDERYVRI
jgi:hypothetical protein